MRNDDDGNRIYKVIINHEEQYSIWFADQKNAPGWMDVGETGTRKECLEYIESVWTDMRPLNLRKHMEQIEIKKKAVLGAVKNNP